MSKPDGSAPGSEYNPPRDKKPKETKSKSVPRKDKALELASQPEPGPERMIKIKGAWRYRPRLSDIERFENNRLVTRGEASHV